jgi:hypothetical protein
MGGDNPNAEIQSGASSFASLCLRPLEVLKTGEPHATIDRLFKSDHVKDLRLVAAFALMAFYSITLVLLIFVWFQPHRDAWSGWGVAREFIAFFGPTLVIVAGILGWTYQTGSSRLGVVDLFACEISTLCKVAAVNETVHSRVTQFGKGLGPVKPAGSVPEARPFTSQETYFPVFEHDPSSLQPLEAKVVVNITEFYTFMKAARDFMRALAAAEPLPADREPWAGNAPPGSWREASRNVIYMLFLALESARKAINQLVEFEPESVERTIIVLISELEAYHFLRGQYDDPDDAHAGRIRLREADYEKYAPMAYWAVKRGLDSAPKLWRAAEPLLPELAKRYKEATGHDLDEPSRGSTPSGSGQTVVKPAAPLVEA